jgi:predicted nucleic acid-binding protein
MKALIDTNVLLDVFLEREPFWDSSAHVVGLAEKGQIEGWIGGTTVTTIFYLLNKALSRKKAENNIKKLLKIFNISGITRVVLEDALDSNFKDYEDAVLHQSAVHSNLDVIITRNQKDFGKSKIPVYSPTELLNIWEKL